MREGFERKGGPHRRMWGVAEGVEAERVEELLELIWTMREKGVSDLDQLFETTEEEGEEEACKLEHILSPSVTESVCTFLGHPPTCIHGKPIPRGECCAKFKKEMKPLVIPLEELGLGEEGRIVFIAPKSHERLDRLSTLGIVPGSVVRMHQKNPSHVLQIGETTLALDKEIVKDIYVKKV